MTDRLNDLLKNERMILILCFLTIIFVGTILYMNTMDNSFNFDDHSIYERTHLLESKNLASF